MPFPEAASRPFRMRAEGGPPTEIDPLRAAVTVGFGAPEYSVVAMRRGYSGRFILRTTVHEWEGRPKWAERGGLAEPIGISRPRSSRQANS
jgi:hypothetical protein